MSDSDNEYIEDGSSGNDRNHNVGRGQAAGTRQQKNKERSDGRLKPRARREERWERSLKDLDDRGAVAADDGHLTENLARVVEAQKRARIRQDAKPFQRGIIRHMVLVLDVSEAMLEKDMRPNRYRVMLLYAVDYIREYFEQNPISQLTVLAMYDGKCIKISELSGNPNEHIEAIRQLRDGKGADTPPREPKGSPSIQNALELSRAMLYHTPKHGTREVLIILGALLTNDPGDIHQTIAACVKDRLRVNIIGMLAKMKICQDIVKLTNGGDESSYAVAVDQLNLRELMMATTAPPVMRSTEQEATIANLLVMGFPSRMDEEFPSLCACHGEFTRGGYICPRCKTKVCSLPQTCPACGLTLILSTHLARSYHHLFPLRNWMEVSWKRARLMNTTQCKGCLRPFPEIPPMEEIESSDDQLPNGTTNGVSNAVRNSKIEGASESARYECQICHNHFCVDCDVFCHQTLFNCPGCQSGPPVKPKLRLNGAVSGEPMDVDP
jgi:transcription initiation factor TFIIH subunit 2